MKAEEYTQCALADCTLSGAVEFSYTVIAFW